MKPAKIEVAVINAMLRDAALRPIRMLIDFDSVAVQSREYTHVGFLTDFERSNELILFPRDTSLRWGGVGARLNSTKIETGYLVYVDNGYLTAVEGYTYGDEWPLAIEHYELYALVLGKDLDEQS